jgi:hypothetical protein
MAGGAGGASFSGLSGVSGLSDVGDDTADDSDPQPIREVDGEFSATGCAAGGMATATLAAGVSGSSPFSSSAARERRRPVAGTESRAPHEAHTTVLSSFGLPQPPQLTMNPDSSCP